MNEKIGVVDLQKLKTANRKQQNTDNVLSLAENCDIKLEILHKHNPFEPIRDPNNCDVGVIFLWRFFTCPRNYYNDNNIGLKCCNALNKEMSELADQGDAWTKISPKFVEGYPFSFLFNMPHVVRVA